MSTPMSNNSIGRPAHACVGKRGQVFWYPFSVAQPFMAGNLPANDTSCPELSRPRAAQLGDGKAARRPRIPSHKWLGYGKNKWAGIRQTILS